MVPASGSGAGPSGKALPSDPLVDMRNAPWVEKYRPRSLDDVAAHKGIIDTSKDQRSWSAAHQNAVTAGPQL